MSTRIVLSFTFFIVLGITGKAQVVNSKFNKLEKLFEEERYEDCAYKAENYTFREKTRREPEPYLYISMCYYELAQLPEMEEKYPRAMKEAIKYAGKYRRKDRDDEYYEDNKSYLNQLKAAAIKKAEEHFAEADYRKAASYYGKILKFDELDYNVMFMEGVCDMMSRNLSAATRSIHTSLDYLIPEYERTTYVPDEISEHLLIKGFVAYSDYLNENEETDSSKATIAIAKEMFPDNTDILEQYNQLHQGTAASKE